jgi:hypothetical protein
MKKENNMHIPYLKLSTPSRRIDDPKFKYIPAAKTDVRRTWRKARLLIRIQQRAQEAAA